VNKRSVSIFKEKEDRKASISLVRLLILGLCLAFSLATASVPAEAQQTENLKWRGDTHGIS
jgi:hypothetical protein